MNESLLQLNVMGAYRKEHLKQFTFPSHLITLFTAWKMLADGSVKIPKISNAEILFMKLDLWTCHNCPQFVHALSLEKHQFTLSRQSLGILLHLQIHQLCG